MPRAFIKALCSWDCETGKVAIMRHFNVDREPIKRDGPKAFAAYTGPLYGDFGGERSDLPTRLDA